jgi:hypothetical protein
MKFRILKDENGSSMMIFAFMFVVIIGMAGLVVDVGILYETKSSLKKTANAAALSGAQELINGDEAVYEVVMNILEANHEKESLKGINTGTHGKYSLNVVLEKDVPLYFLRLFKMNSMKISESSTAVLVSMTRAVGAVPLGIDESIPLEYMKEYSLKVDSGDSQYGNFGVLALSGTGAKLYEQDLRSGYNQELKVGDIISTQTGNIEGKTRDAISYRITSSPYIEGDISHRDDPRIILILVYKPYKVDTNQIKEVEITGFAYFYIKSPMDLHDSSIKGYFIKRAGTGIGEDEITSKGAYAIRLVE